MSNTSTTQPIIEQNVMIPMRDGTLLAADIYRPAEQGSWPVLLTRLPYNKNLRHPADPEKRVYLELNFDVERAMQAGYVIVAQDCRGRYASEGHFTPAVDDAIDGSDTIAWAAAQPWSTGQVGMFGESYQGLTQLLAAAERPVALQAIAPMHAPTWIMPYRHGAFLPAVFQWWALTQGAIPEMQRRLLDGRAQQADLDALLYAEQHLQELFEHLPMADMPMFKDVAPYYFEWLADPAAQATQYAELQRTLYRSIRVPALVIGGWYDYFLSASIEHYQYLKQQGGSAQARSPQLIIGPWTHVDFPGMFAERDYGPLSGTRAIDLTGIQMRWFDHWLKGIDNQAEQAAPVRIFIMGIDQWRTEANWPLPDTNYRRYYLHSGGHANSATGDGQLLLDAPGEQPADSYQYDPHNPVPTVGGAIMLMTAPGEINSGPLDQRLIEQRDDVLCYTSAVLAQPLEVTGPISLVLYASSSAPDTDFTAKLVDLAPDGRAEILTDGIVRARYRRSLTEPTMMQPGVVYELRIDVGATANVFRAGHRIRLDLSSSNFPRFDRNSNTGGAITDEHARDLLQARNLVHHNPTYSSYLLLPIIERA